MPSHHEIHPAQSPLPVPDHLQPGIDSRFNLDDPRVRAWIDEHNERVAAPPVAPTTVSPYANASDESNRIEPTTMPPGVEASEPAVTATGSRPSQPEAVSSPNPGVITPPQEASAAPSAAHLAADLPPTETTIPEPEPPVAAQSVPSPSAEPRPEPSSATTEPTSTPAPQATVSPDPEPSKEEVEPKIAPLHTTSLVPKTLSAQVDNAKEAQQAGAHVLLARRPVVALIGGASHDLDDATIALENTAPAMILKTRNVHRTNELHEGRPTEPVVIAVVHAQPEWVNELPVPQNDNWPRLVRHILGDPDDLLAGVAPETYGGIMSDALPPDLQQGHAGLEVATAVAAAVLKQHGQISFGNLAEGFQSLRGGRKGFEVPTLDERTVASVKDALAGAYREQDITAIVTLGQWAASIERHASQQIYSTKQRLDAFAKQNPMSRSGITVLDLPTMSENTAGVDAELALKVSAIRERLGKRTRYGTLIGAIVTGASVVRPDQLMRLTTKAVGTNSRLLLAAQDASVGLIEATLREGAYGIMHPTGGDPTTKLLEFMSGTKQRKDLMSRTDTIAGTKGGGFTGAATRTHEKKPFKEAAEHKMTASTVSTNAVRTANSSVATSVAYAEGPRYLASEFGDVPSGSIVIVDTAARKRTSAVLPVGGGPAISDFPIPPERMPLILDVLDETREMMQKAEEQMRRPVQLPHTKPSDKPTILPAPESEKMLTRDAGLKDTKLPDPAQAYTQLRVEFFDETGHSVNDPLRALFRARPFAHFAYSKWGQERANSMTELKWDEWATRHGLPLKRFNRILGFRDHP